MSIDEDRKARQDRMLDELADIAMDLAQDLAGKAKQAATLEDAERYTALFDRLARSVRLSVALSRRLERDDARASAEHRTKAVDLRKARLRARLRSEIAESDANLVTRLERERELDDTIAEDALYDRFLAVPLDEAISKLRNRLDLPDPPPGRSPIEGEVDRDERRETEGGEERGFAESKAAAIDNDLSIAATNAHSRLHSLQPPQSTASTAPPDGEHLGTRKPSPS